MINEMEWLDEDNILIATGNGFRVFNIQTDEYTLEYFKQENIKTNSESNNRYWIRNFEIIDEKSVYASANEGDIYLFNFQDSSILNISINAKLSNTDATNLLFSLVSPGAGIELLFPGSPPSPHGSFGNTQFSRSGVQVLAIQS